MKVNVENIFASDEYSKMLSIICKEIEEGIDFCHNEAQVADLFERTIYFHVRNVFGLSHNDIRPKREVNHTDSGIIDKFIGRIDSLYNSSFIIEYKHYNKLKTEKNKTKAIQQISDYMKQLHDVFVSDNNAEDNINCGMLIDGKKVMFFFYDKNKLEHTPFRKISINTLDIVVKRIVFKDKKQFLSENIKNDFSVCRGNTCAKVLARALFNSLKDKNISSATTLMMKEWEVLFHLSENDNGQSNDIRKRRQALGDIFSSKIKDNSSEYKALYALQTTYAIIVKLIAVKMISKVIFDKKVVFFEDLSSCTSDNLRLLMSNIENGYNVSLMGIHNLIEGDFFSWYAVTEQWNDEIYKSFVNIIEKIEEYSSFTNDINIKALDIFRELYMEVMPNAVRHSLGEYYTPAWLADHVISNGLEYVNDNWRAVDSCCGSGVFLTRLIDKIYSSVDIDNLSIEEKKELINDILNRVIGVDINPISTLTARVTYCLAILPLIKDTGMQINIPVYLGDSANPKVIENVDGIDCYIISIMIHDGESLDICLPVSFVDDCSFERSMHRLEALSISSGHEVIFDKLIQSIGEQNLNDNIKERINTFCVQIDKMSKDGIAINWLRIIANYMSVARIKDIDLIVGNPPWVKWEHLPQKYAEKIKKQCIEKHLFSGQSYMGAIQLNICALIADITASHWLTKNGVLAFLMPKTMLTQDSYAGFRNFYIDYEKNERLYLQKIDDWSKSGHPFIYTTEDFATFFYSRNLIDYKKGVPVKFYKKKRGVLIGEINESSNFQRIKKSFDCTDGIAFQLGEDRTGFTVLSGNLIDSAVFNVVGECAYKARTGVEFTPSEVYWLNYNVDLSNENCNVFENIKLTRATHKAVTLGAPFVLETEYVYPLVLGPSIKKYRLDYKEEYCLFPYYYKDGECKLADASKLLNDSEKLYDYFNKNKEVITGQSKRSISMKKGNEFYALSKVGPYTFSNIAVAFRDNTCMSAVVLAPKKTGWGDKKQYICAKHAAFISVDKENNYITEDEAYYIAAIMNTSVVEQYFKSTYSGRSYSIKNINIFMPKYTQENDKHKKLSELSRKAHAEKDDMELTIIEHEIEKIYKKMCSEK